VYNLKRERESVCVCMCVCVCVLYVTNKKHAAIGSINISKPNIIFALKSERRKERKQQLNQLDTIVSYMF
jgi:hypothetical protein